MTLSQAIEQALASLERLERCASNLLFLPTKARRDIKPYSNPVPWLKKAEEDTPTYPDALDKMKDTLKQATKEKMEANQAILWENRKILSSILEILGIDAVDYTNGTIGLDANNSTPQWRKADGFLITLAFLCPTEDLEGPAQLKLIESWMPTEPQPLPPTQPRKCRQPHMKDRPLSTLEVERRKLRLTQKELAAKANVPKFLVEQIEKCCYKPFRVGPKTRGSEANLEQFLNMSIAQLQEIQGTK